ncbi:MAG: MinD/ParA family ATP-binding protein [Candidatus Kariarchaeaceae archaeon]|jgi:MinD-like ATPase involved in chromosome partitioning or flagellar assembly
MVCLEGTKMESLAIHSHKGGVGKTTIALNLAIMLAKEGKNVCILDNDLAAPNLHTFFNEIDSPKYLNDYFDDEIEISDCVYDFTSKFNLSGNLYVGFSDPTEKSMGQMLRLDARAATNMLKHLMKIKTTIRKDPYNVDYLILDTTPGITLTTINSFILTDNIMFIIKLSNADIDGTTHMISGLLDNLPARAMLIANLIPSEKISTEDEKEELYKLVSQELKSDSSSSSIEFVGWIETDLELQGIELENALKSLRGEQSDRVIFSLDQPDHPFTTSLREIRNKLFND